MNQKPLCTVGRAYASLGVMAGFSLAAFYLATVDFLVAGALLFLSGILGAVLTAATGTVGDGPKKADTIKDFLQRNPEGAEDSDRLAVDLRGMLKEISSHGDSIRNVVRYLQEHAMLVAWLIDNFDQAAKDANKLISDVRVSSGEVSDRGARVLAGVRKGEDFVNGIVGSAKDLSGNADSLSVSAKNTQDVVAQLQVAYKSIKAAIDKLAEVSDHSTNFVSEVGATMGSIREKAQASLELFKNVEDYTRRGRQVVGMVGNGVEEIRVSAEATLLRIDELRTQSKQIEDVLGIINDVADETNLLALNAAILAAQAGERGAGFAVVADQIRSLAHRTRESIEHIENIIRSIQKKVRETDEFMRVSVRAVEQGQALGKEAVVQLNLIEEAVSSSVGQAAFIAEAVERQDNQSSQMVAISMEVNLELHGVVSILQQSSDEMARMGVLIRDVSDLSSSVRTAAESNHRSALEVGQLMANFVGQVEEIENLVGKQREGVSTLDEAMTSVASSAESTRESLDSIHNIVNELVSHADSLQDEVEGCGLTEDPEAGKV